MGVKELEALGAEIGVWSAGKGDILGTKSTQRD